MSNKPVLTGLFRDRPDTPEGKYLVKRRDGSVPTWPSFVLGGADPYAAVALRAYADAVEDEIRALGEVEARDRGLTLEWVAALRRLAEEFTRYRMIHGEGDPGMGPHRKDDPATVEEMKKGRSA